MWVIANQKRHLLARIWCWNEDDGNENNHRLISFHVGSEVGTWGRHACKSVSSGYGKVIAKLE